MKSESSALLRVVTLYNDTETSSIFHQISEAILTSLNSIEELTTDKLAERCYTSRTTINRYVRELGYPAYSSLRRDLAKNVRDRDYLFRVMPAAHSKDFPLVANDFLNTAIELLSSLQNDNTYSTIENAAAVIHEKKRICILSYDEKQASSFQANLFMAGKEVRQFNVDFDLSPVLDLLDQDSAIVFFFPDTPGQAGLVDFLAASKQRNATNIVIASGLSYPIEKYSDYLISFNGTRTGMDTMLFKACLSLLHKCYRIRYASLH